MVNLPATILPFARASSHDLSVPDVSTLEIGEVQDLVFDLMQQLSAARQAIADRDSKLRDAEWENTDLSYALKEKNRQIAEDYRLKKLAEKKLEEKEKCIITSISNLDAFNQEAPYRQRRANKGHEQLFFIMIDLTKFKNINDTYGHDGGNIVLKQVAIGLKQTIRKEDMAIHFSGDEFGVLISSDQAGAQCVYEKIEDMFDKMIIPVGDHNVRVQGNLGMTQYQPGESLQALVNRADLIMYEGKAARGVESRNKPGQLKL